VAVVVVVHLHPHHHHPGHLQDRRCRHLPLQVLVLAPKAGISSIAQLATLMVRRSVAKLAQEVTHPTVTRQIVKIRSRSALQNAVILDQNRANQRMPRGIMA